ncbi:keratinocyte-associated protein 3 [Malaclemys terrapin pileata]|uniref:keratinocyte-associated protein 3 n=1 Tax=Malaclemys terrapin pileata TaxID=2991368 RepID=UPI0023A80663|nr:keratinocyte-associated protein 3 [Malaclemys terrapin pileata]
MSCGSGCGFDLGRGPQRLMRSGITLIVLGHVNFILGAIVHGTVLRHVANPERTVTSEYTTANVISVGSGLLSITAGIVAILVSRNLLKAALHWALLCVSLLNCLLSAACSLGLALAISLTIASRGHRLMVGCNSSTLPADARAAIATNDCPFNTTRIYDTALALWFPSMVMAAVEAALSGRCCVVSLILRGIGPCADTNIRQQLEEETATKEVASEDRHTQELCQLLAVEDGARA